MNKWHRRLRLAGLATTGLLFQAGGCAFDPGQLFATVVTSFVGITVNTFVSSLLGVPVF